MDTLSTLVTKPSGEYIDWFILFRTVFICLYVCILNLNLNFLLNGNSRWWAFRNYAYFVMKSTWCEIHVVRHLDGEAARVTLASTLGSYEVIIYNYYIGKKFFCMFWRWNFQIWILCQNKYTGRFFVTLSLCSIVCVYTTNIYIYIYIIMLIGNAI